ncbi:hypothetical protein AGIG_G13560 [Arapaima gigas]
MTTETQRSTLMTTRRKMLLNMLRNMMKEVNLHMKTPKIHSLVAMYTAVMGRETQKVKSEMAKLRQMTATSTTAHVQDASAKHDLWWFSTTG